MNTKEVLLICPMCKESSEPQVAKLILTTENTVNYIAFLACHHNIFKQSVIDECLKNAHPEEKSRIEAIMTYNKQNSLWDE